MANATSLTPPSPSLNNALCVLDLISFFNLFSQNPSNVGLFLNPGISHKSLIPPVSAIVALRSENIQR